MLLFGYGYRMQQAEFAAMWLANKIGINTASVKLKNSAGKYILLVERFDRINIQQTWTRKFMVSALTLLGLDENEGRYASYLNLAEQIRKYAKNPIADLHELYQRMVFNILVGNTDDHAKNHAFFWDGHYYTLTPAYDICPYLRAGHEATQAMTVGEMGNYSLLKNALTAANCFGFTEEEAKKKINALVDAVKTFWPEACKQAELTAQQKKQLTGTAVLNPFCFFEQT